MRFSSTILCVDDDEDDQLFLREAILAQPHPFEVKEVKDGREAIAYLQECLEKKELPCLVIMDLNMPRMDGKQTISKIMSTEGLGGVKLAVFTTSSNAADKKYFEEKGVYFITKPFDYSVFKQEIAHLLDSCGGFK